MTIARGDVEETISAISSGTVTANADAMIAAGYMGIVINRPVEEGDHVTKGQELVDDAKRSVWPRVAAAVADLCGNLDGPILEQLATIEDRLIQAPLTFRGAAKEEIG